MNQWETSKVTNDKKKIEGKENTAVISTDDLVFSIGEKTVQLLEKNKIISILRSRIKQLNDKMDKAIANTSKELKESNQKYAKKNKVLADEIEKLRKENEQLKLDEETKRKRDSSGKFVKEG